MIFRKNRQIVFSNKNPIIHANLKIIIGNMENLEINNH